MSLKGILAGAASGIMNKYNRETLGPDYMERQARLQDDRRKMEAQLAAEEIQRKYNLGRLTEQETATSAEQAQARSEGFASVPEMRAAHAVEGRSQANAKAEAELGNIGSEIDLRGAQANAAARKPEDAVSMLLLKNQLGEPARQDRERLTSMMIANLASLINERNRKGGVQGDTLSAEAFPAWLKAATEQAMLRFPNPTPQQTQQVLQEMLGLYQTVSGGSRTAPTGFEDVRAGASGSAVPSRPTGPVGAAAGFMAGPPTSLPGQPAVGKTVLYHGQQTPCGALPPQIQAIAKQRGDCP